MTAPPRIIAVCGSYLELIQAFRARLRELDISYATFDEITGWTDSYSSKVFGTEPMKRFGLMALDAAMGTAGVKLVMVEDPVTLARTLRSCQYVKKSQRSPWMRSDAVHGEVVQRVRREFLRQIGAIGGRKTAQNLPRRRARTIAKKAARARWDKSLRQPVRQVHGQQ